MIINFMHHATLRANSVYVLMNLKAQDIGQLVISCKSIEEHMFLFRLRDMQ